MTVANVVIGADRACLVSDTVGYIGKEPAVLHRKLRVAVAAGVAYMVRGRTNLAILLEAVAAGWGTFDQAVEETETLLLGVQDDHLSNNLAEVTLLGWSDGPVGVRFHVNRTGIAVAVTKTGLARGVYLAPALGAHKIPDDLSDNQLFQVSLLQQKIAVNHILNMCVGGDVELAEVTADGVSIRSLGEYPNKAETEEQIALGEFGDTWGIAA